MAGAFNLGQSFTVDAVGLSAVGARFYMPATEDGTHTARLYSSSCSLLASVTFSGETTGWNRADFTTPVALTNGATYTVAVNTNTAWSKRDDGNPASISGVMHTPTDSANYSEDSTACPTTPGSFNNYLRDIVLTDAGGVVTPPDVQVVQLSPDDQTRLDLTWYGVWLVAGVLLVLIVAPMFVRSFRFWH